MRKRIINCDNYLGKKIYCDRNEHSQCKICNDCFSKHRDRYQKKCDECKHRCPKCNADCTKCYLGCDNRRAPYKSKKSQPNIVI